MYFLIGFETDIKKFILFFIMFLETITLYTFYGQTLTYILPSPALAQVLGGSNLISLI